MSNKKIYTLIDLFAGCGGLSLGMEQAGFTSIFFNEIVPVFVSTYKANRNLSDDSCYVGDINELNKHISEYEHIWNNFQHPYSLCTRYRSSRLLRSRPHRCPPSDFGPVRLADFFRSAYSVPPSSLPAARAS